VRYDLIDSAKTSVLVVAFAAYRVPKLVQALRRAVERHVRVIVVLEDRKESGGKLTVRHLPQTILPSERVCDLMAA
jgi:phosphatidylserine/phosphatidylglycerophosphate/cardiolipin synthase-like enzyme